MQDRLAQFRPGYLDDGLPERHDDPSPFVSGVRTFLDVIGEDPNRPGLQRTPERLWNALVELTTPPPTTPGELLGVTFNDVDYPSDEMIAVGPVSFVSLCEHHLLPFTGTAWVGYIPTHGRVVGLSKLARLVDYYARRPQVQERLTTQVAEAVLDHLDPIGSACVIRATHACMTMRGIRADGASMVTSVMFGAFRDKPATRAEFMDLTH